MCETKCALKLLVVPYFLRLEVSDYFINCSAPHIAVYHRELYRRPEETVAISSTYKMRPTT